MGLASSCQKSSSHISFQGSPSGSFDEKYALKKAVRFTDTSDDDDESTSVDSNSIQGELSTRIAVRKSDKTKVLVKLVEKKGLSKCTLNTFASVIEELRHLRHTNIVEILDVFEDNSKVYIVTEHLGGENMKDRLSRTKCTEEEAKIVISQLVSAVSDFHEMKIAHRDLKLENILYVSEESEEIRIAEFGLASLWSTLAGTIAYTAPEAIDRGFRGTVTFDDFAAGDMWALGVIAYAVLSGSLPFHESRHLALFAKIRNAEYNFDGERWSSISDDAKDFVRSLLNRDPNMRSTAASALSHRWLRVTPSNLSLSLHGRGADCADLLRIKIPHLTIEEELKQSSCDKPLAAHRSDSSDTSATTATNSSANSPLTDRSNLSPQEDSVSPSPQLSSWL